jgi:hypothetical protein
MLNRHRSEAQLVSMLTKFLMENSNTGAVSISENAITEEAAEAERLGNCKERAEDFLRNLSDEECEDKDLEKFLAKKYHDISEWWGTRWEDCGKKIQGESFGKVYQVLEWIEEFKAEQDEIRG